MATIGTFTKKDTTYQGTITTMSLKAKVNITPVERENDKAPDFRVYAGSAEIGAAWSTTAKNGNAYLSVKLDDPSFVKPIFARLSRMAAITSSSGPADPTGPGASRGHFFALDERGFSHGVCGLAQKSLFQTGRIPGTQHVRGCHWREWTIRPWLPHRWRPGIRLYKNPHW